MCKTKSVLKQFAFAAWAGVALFLGSNLSVAVADSFYCDPVLGNPSGDGTQSNPWRTLQEVISGNLIQTYDRNGNTLNPNAPVHPGDTILLRSGYQGVVYIAKGYNDLPITIAADDGETPQLGWIIVREGSRWTFRGLTISPEFAPPAAGNPPTEIVRFAENGTSPSSELIIEDSFIFTVADSSNWTANDWINNAATGIRLGRHGTGHIARNNYIMNVRFGINLCAYDCIAEGNVIDSFSGDGIRATRDGQVVQYNVIKNCRCSAADGDTNHDDGIQCFLFNVGYGTVQNVTIRGNLVIARDDDNLPMSAPLMGITGFDGPLVNFLVEDNVVLSDQYHGVSLYDAVDCLVQNNTCYSRWSTIPKPWVMIGKKRVDPSGNTVLDNFAHSFNFRAEPTITEANNLVVTPAIFQDKHDDLAALIDLLFDNYHPTANRMRILPLIVSSP